MNLVKHELCTEIMDPASDSTISHEFILESLPHPVLTVDRRNNIVYANFASESFFGTSIANLKRTNLEKLLPFGSPTLDLVERVKSRNAAVREFAINLSSPKIGMQTFVDIFAAPVLDHPGSVVLILQRRNVADKIDRQLTHRGAARTVVGLAQMLAHEIKNPLSGIRGAAQLLENAVESEDQNLTRLIMQETDRIVRLVDRMEVFSDGRSPERDPVNIHSILDHVKDIAKNGFGSNVKFLEYYDPSIPPVYANRDQLVQVFLNLVKNGCEAIKNRPDGVITLKTAYRPGIKLVVSGSGEPVSLPMEFSVSDNGEGIEESILPNVFDPFITTKTNGTGLGLALVSKIVRDHGGVIEIENANPGATVSIHLPAWKRNKSEGTK